MQPATACQAGQTTLETNPKLLKSHKFHETFDPQMAYVAPLPPSRSGVSSTARVYERSVKALKFPDLGADSNWTRPKILRGQHAIDNTS